MTSNVRPRSCVCSPLAALVVAMALVNGACSEKPLPGIIVHGGSGPPTLVLLHGYGSSAEEWMQFTRTIRWPAGGRFVFPQGPDAYAPSAGPAGPRAWWPLYLRSHIPPGQSMPDLSTTRPPGLRTAADRVEDLLKAIDRSPGGPIVLGGFSQGAMVASEVAFQSDTPLAGLVLLSGTVVDEASWRANYARRRGLPVFVAHGRRDGVLPYAASDRMRQDLQAAGLDVTWCAFDGGHDLSAEVIRELNRFLARWAVDR
jgi:phospholipase/carboxylesterase